MHSASIFRLAEALGIRKAQIGYILHDPQISRARKMLTTEQFQNPQMASRIIRISCAASPGVYAFLFVRADFAPEIMAAQLCLLVGIVFGDHELCFIFETKYSMHANKGKAARLLA